MKTFCRLFLAVLALGAFTCVQAQRTPVQKNGRDIAQRERLKRLMARVGVEVPETAGRPEQTPTRGGQPHTYRELKIRFADQSRPGNGLKPATEQTKTSEQTQPSEQSQAPTASIVEDKRRAGALARPRSLELATTQIFIAAVDATNKLRWWSIVPDPRIVRSETQSPSGELRATDYYVSNVTLVVAFPDDPEITNLRFYHPVWNGTDFDLKPLTTVPTR